MDEEGVSGGGEVGEKGGTGRGEMDEDDVPGGGEVGEGVPGKGKMDVQRVSVDVRW